MKPVTTKHKLLFIFAFGMIGIPVSAAGFLWRVITLGWENGRIIAEDLFMSAMERHK